MNVLAFLNSFGSWDMVIILVIGLLLFGKRLPDVGRSLGKGIVEFKRGLKGVEEEIEDQSSKPTSSTREQLPPYRAPVSAHGEDPRVAHGEPVSAEPAKDRTSAGG